jgi:hypothetical protein
MVEIVESTVRKFTVEGHLTALEPRAYAPAGTSRLTLAAATGGFTPTAAFAATNTLLPVHCTRDILKFVEFHWISYLGAPTV